MLGVLFIMSLILNIAAVHVKYKRDYLRQQVDNAVLPLDQVITTIGWAPLERTSEQIALAPSRWYSGNLEAT
jgi:hypothetical protein